VSEIELRDWARSMDEGGEEGPMDGGDRWPKGARR
jgi:hypothetical protein